MEIFQMTHHYWKKVIISTGCSWLSRIKEEKYTYKPNYNLYHCVLVITLSQQVSGSSILRSLLLFFFVSF